MIPEIVSFHEASHCVESRLHGAHILSCEVVDHFLLTRNSGGNFRWQPLHDENVHLRKVHLLTDMAILVAGTIGTRIFCPAAAMMCQANGLNDFDLRAYHKLAVLYTFGEEGSTQNRANWDLPVIEEVWSRTELELKANWQSVEAVAKHLMRYGTIDQAAIDREIKKAGGRKSVCDFWLEHGSQEEKAAAKRVRVKRSQHNRL